MRKLYVALTLFVLSFMNVGAQTVMTGVEVLREEGFAQLKGKRVGLVTNPSGVDRNLNSTIDILFKAPEVKLVALFGPEHGVRGDVYAGGKVSDSVDSVTGLPVDDVEFTPVGMDETKRLIAVNAVEEAWRNPFEVTTIKK